METGTELVLGVSEFVAYVNQTLEVAYPHLEVEGELSNFRVSKNKWVYFDLKDETASLRCFATVYALPGPLEDGMVVRAAGSPRVHPLYNFSFNVQHIVPVGEGSLRRAADLLAAKLEKEGL
ncbi:exodeoxyribonuclease VII large subunit, partial [Candidatus Saccharibacteria bacterium]|nr:exodeoxyribonuclease VII large subunit [Candidatus Saccharibacteria bacterium]